jgi:hypothetical protein
VTTIVTLLDVVPGAPPAILTRARFRLKTGGTKTITQKVPVHDPALFRRFVAEIAKGDEVEITVTTDWSKPGLPTQLDAFARVRVPEPHRTAG